MTNQDSEGPAEDFLFEKKEKMPWLGKRRWANYKALLEVAKKKVTDRENWKPANGEADYKRWGDDLLTVAEHEMLFATATGLYLPAKYEEKDRDQKTPPIPTDRIDVTRYKLPDPNRHNAERWIGADLLRWLITDQSLSKLRDPLGVFFIKSVVVGELNLDHVVEPRLRVAGLTSTFVGTVTARHAHLHALALCGSTIIPSAQTIAQSDEYPEKPFLTKLTLHEEPTIKNIPDTSTKEGYRTPEIHRFSAMSLAADSLTLEADCNLTRGFTAKGPVDLDRCRVAGSMNLLDSRFETDSLGSDYIPALSMEAARIKQDLVMMRAKVFGVTHLYKINVDGHIGLQGAFLHYVDQTNHAYKQKQKREWGAKRVSSYRAALNIAEAHVSGNINLSSAMRTGICYEYAAAEPPNSQNILRTIIRGGMRLRLAQIGGDLKLHSSKIYAAKFRSAVDATSARVKGSVMAQRAHNHAMGQQSFEAYGNIRFRAARIGGQLDFTAAKLRKRLVDKLAESGIGKTKPRDYMPTHTWSLDLRNARVGAQVKLDEDFVAERGVCLRGARVTDRVTIEGKKGRRGCRITAPDPNKHPRSLGRAIDAYRIQIGGAFYLDGPDAKVTGKMDFSLARIRGRFGIGRRIPYRGKKTIGYTLDKDRYGLRVSDGVKFDDVNIIDSTKQGRWVHIKPFDTVEDEDPTSTLAEIGLISLQHARIGFELAIGPPTMREKSKMQTLLVNNPVLIDGRIDAVHAVIDYQVCLGRATFNYTKDAEKRPTPKQNTSNPSKDDGLPGTSERVPGLTQYNAAIDFTGATVGTDFYVDGAIILGGLCLDSIDIAQDLVLRRGLAYSESAALALWPDCDKDNKVIFDDRGVCGEKLRNKRHDSRSWSLSMRHGTVQRTASIRPAFAAFGALTILRSNVNGYFELCPTNEEILDLEWNAKSNHEPIVNQYSRICAEKNLSNWDWYVTWLINLSGTQVGVLWWSLERSGHIDKDDIDSPSAKGSLADLLFINDFAYDNFWFFKDNPNKKNPVSSQLGPADERLIHAVDSAHGDTEACRRFLELQTLPTTTIKSRQERLAIGDEVKRGTRIVHKQKLANRLRKFNPQPYEHMASVSKTHGRSDLFAWCHEEKWKRLTNQHRPQNLLKKTAQWAAFILGLFAVYTPLLMIEGIREWANTFWGCILLLGFVLVSYSIYFLKYDPYLQKIRDIKLVEPSDPERKTLLWIALRLFGSFAGYGYRPRLLVRRASYLFLLGAFISSLGYHLDIIRPSSSIGDRVLLANTDDHSINKDRLDDLADDNAYASDYPAFNSFWYAADLLIPVIGLEQAEYWQPFPFSQDSKHYEAYAQQKQMPALEMYRTNSDSTGHDWLDQTLGFLTYPVYQPVRFCLEVFNDHRSKEYGGWIAFFAILIYMTESLYTILGWVFVTLGIASATRLIRHE
ncbi:MAG: hypothetical protein AAGI37_17585 [Planctomycetota bacterium]